MSLSPKDRPSIQSPHSTNKSLLLYTNGGGDEDDDEEENLWSLAKPDLTTLAEFIPEALTVNANQGLLIFAQTLLESSGGDFLNELLLLERVKFQKSWLLHEILKTDVKMPTSGSKVLNKFKAINAAAHKIELDICEQLTCLQKANLVSKTLDGFDFDQLAEYCQFVDALTDASKLERKIQVTETIVVVVQGILEAAITMSLRLASSKDLNTEFLENDSNIGERAWAYIDERFAEQELTNEALSNKLDDITACLRQLLATAKEGVPPVIPSRLTRPSGLVQPVSRGRPSIPELSKTELLRSALDVKPSFQSSLGERTTLDKRHISKSESSHEAKAAALHSSSSLAQLTTSTKSGSTYDKRITVNDLYCRHLPTTNSSFGEFVTSPNEITAFLRSGQLVIPGFNLIQHSAGRTSGSTDKVGRQIAHGKLGSLYVRELSLIQGLEKSALTKEQTTLINPAAGLPKSLAHMARFITEQIAGMKEGVLHSYGPFDDEGMMGLIEKCSASMMANFSEASAKLLDGIKMPCMSPEGHWRGLLQLFWHQYSRAFSPRRQDGCSIFYPEALNRDFIANRDTLFSEYNWLTQLTMELGNAMRLQCWKCNGTSDVSYQSCLSSECKKKRTDEDNLHVYLVKGGGPSGALVASCRLSKG